MAMYDITKEKHVGFLQFAVDELLKRLLIQEGKLLVQNLELKLSAEVVLQLTQDLKLLREKFFAGRSERNPAKNKTKKNHRRKSQAELICHNQRPVDVDEVNTATTLESEEVIHELSSAQENCCAGCDLKEMAGAFEESSEIDVISKQYIVRRHKRKKYKCTACQKIVTALPPTKLKAGSGFSIEMAVSVVDDKFHRHIPLNRQSEIMKEHGLEVGTKTLFSLSEHLSSLVGDMPERILAEIKSHPHVHIDETPIKILQGGVDKTATPGYVWSVSNNQGCYYQYETTRSSKVARELLNNYRGIVMADGYQGYDFIERENKITLVLCWAHVRRKFFDALDSYPEASKILNLIDTLYTVEHKAQDFNALSGLRSSESKLIVEEIKSWSEKQEGFYLHSSLLGKAISYMTEHWLRLTQFIENSAVPIDNNAAERSQRAAVMGRNNFQGFRTINGADVGMVFYTIIGSCKLVGLNPKLYLLATAMAVAKNEPTLTPLAYARRMKFQLDEKMRNHEGRSFKKFSALDKLLLQYFYYMTCCRF